jgi:hypothetical protein
MSRTVWNWKGGEPFRTKPDEVLNGSVSYSGRESETQTGGEDGMSYHW